MEENNVPDMRPTFDVIRNVDDKGKEYWSSRELCNAMGYSGYWKFQNVIDKAIRVAGEKGMNMTTISTMWLKWSSLVVALSERSKTFIFLEWLV